LPLPPTLAPAGGAPVSDPTPPTLDRATPPGRGPALRWECQDAPRGRQNGPAGFSFTELLAILGVLSLLFLLQISAFAHNKGDSHRAVCADNLRRLGLSWLMYADDHRGRLAPNQADPFPRTNNWVGGWLDFTSSSDNTNLATITHAKLYPYNKVAEIYRCPDDLSAFRGRLRIRSYSMNGYVGDGARGWTTGFQFLTNLSLVRQPDRTFVFIEEHPDSINDGAFVVDMSVTAPLVDYPASYHYSGANLGFADGSVLYHRWNNIGPIFRSTRGPDVVWLQDRTTYRR
jgi:prepilin-type processing-associated H-X9-DG protein